jgi:DnaD/phage-associated family protein
VSDEGSSRFEGFITGGATVSLPAQLFTEVLPEIDDEAELRVTLHALAAIQRTRGALRAVRASALAAEGPLLRNLEPRGGAVAVREGLQRAVQRGTLLALPLTDEDALIFANSEVGRRNLERVRSGTLAAPGAKVATPGVVVERRDGLAAEFEREIGALTPSTAEALAEAAARYPEGWIVDALRLAAARNARSWRYAAAVLRRWEAEGRDDGDAGIPARDAAAADGAPRGEPRRDPYGGVVRRSWP